MQSPEQTKIRYFVRESCGVIQLEYPPVNSLSLAVRHGIVAAIDKAMSDGAVKAIVLVGSHGSFSCGADIPEMARGMSGHDPDVARVLEILENCHKPVVAAVDGMCMGGGLELALACHYRVAAKDARIAMPEIKLGLMPGAGGTQRLPRLIGVQATLDLVLTGEVYRAETFKDTRLFDALVDGDVLDGAIAFLHRAAPGGWPLRRVRDLNVDDKNAQASVQAARARTTDSPLPAPSHCIEAIAASWQLSFDQGLQLERRGFAALLKSPESRALRHAFAAQRTAARGASDHTSPQREVRVVGVLGAGTMGVGIAMCLANAGLPVVLAEASQAALDKGLAAIRDNYARSQRKGVLSSREVEALVARFRPTLDYADLADCDLVIEAVFEDQQLKEQIFRQLDSICRPGAILASNTSYLNIDTIAACTRRPQDVLGLHFFSPAHVMRLLEVVRGAATSQDTLATCLALAKQIGKVPVVAGVCDGFIGNRMLAKYSSAVNALVLAGASPYQVDQALERFGMAMGPFRVNDLTGLDIGRMTRQRRAREAGLAYVPFVADKLCEAGRLGQKTGAGWYRYVVGSRQALPDPQAEQIIDTYRAESGIRARTVSDEEIVERAVYALVNEGARVLQEGIASRASDIDVVFINGYGFPAHRGGPLFHADTVGLDRVKQALERFASEPGSDASWKPSLTLARLAASGASFN